LLRPRVEFSFLGNFALTHSRTRRSRSKRSITPNYSTQDSLLEYYTAQDRARPSQPTARSKLIYKTFATLVAREYRSSSCFGVRQSAQYTGSGVTILLFPYIIQKIYIYFHCMISTAKCNIFKSSALHLANTMENKCKNIFHCACSQRFDA